MKRLRLSTGLSQDAIEDALNIDQSVLSTYERDARVPRGPVLRKLAEFCGRPTGERVLQFPYSVTVIGEPMYRGIPDHVVRERETEGAQGQNRAA